MHQDNFTHALDLWRERGVRILEVRAKQREHDQGAPFVIVGALRQRGTPSWSNEHQPLEVSA